MTLSPMTKVYETVEGVVVLVIWTWRGVILELGEFRQGCNAVLDDIKETCYP